MKIVQLDHVAIHVSDVERSCEFYARVLGLAPLKRPAFTFPGAWFRLGLQQELHIIGERKQDVASASRGNHYALQVTEIQAWKRRLEEQQIEHRIQQRPDGATQIFLRDPDGHTIELCTPPGAGAPG